MYIDSKHRHNAAEQQLDTASLRSGTEDGQIHSRTDEHKAQLPAAGE